MGFIPVSLPTAAHFFRLRVSAYDYEWNLPPAIMPCSRLYTTSVTSTGTAGPILLDVPVLRPRLMFWPNFTPIPDKLLFALRELSVIWISEQIPLAPLPSRPRQILFRSVPSLWCLISDV